MNILKRLCALLVCALLIIPEAAAYAAPASTVTLKKGDYIALGSYMGEPVIWRCVGSDSNGILLLSRDILCFKAYGTDSGRWDKSFLRTWLNSADSSVDWGETAPDEANTDGNAYAGEPGFLSGFTAEEQAVIKTVSQKSVINVNDSDAAQVGNEVHTYNSTGILARAIQNYSKAIGIMTEDRVFCPNLLQMEILATNYPSDIISSPRESAVAQSGNIKNEENSSNNYYWLRDSIGNIEFPERARCVFPNGRIFISDASDSSVGVRPGIYVNEKLKIVSGNGYESSPYTVSDKLASPPVPKGSANANHERKTLTGQFSSITEGDYIYIGKIYGEDILWRCVDINENGPLLLSDRILSFRAFDARGSHRNQLRSSYGSGSWEMSNLRYWLNSGEPTGDKTWPCGNAPSSSETGGANGYSQEAGFLTNFSPEELALIKTVNVRTLLNPADSDKNSGGTASTDMRRNINYDINYDEVYSSYTEDKIFSLNIEEAKTVYRDFGNYLLAVPTIAAVNRNEANIEDLSADRTADWWLRDADGRAEAPYGVRTVTQDAWVDSDYANNPRIGIRPAFYLDMDAARFISGAGTIAEPYRMESHIFSEWRVRRKATCDARGERRRICQICHYAETEPIPAISHNFSMVSVSRSLFFNTTRRECVNCGEVLIDRKAALLPLIIAAALCLASLILLIVRSRK